MTHGAVKFGSTLGFILGSLDAAFVFKSPNALEGEDIKGMIRAN